MIEGVSVETSSTSKAQHTIQTGPITINHKVQIVGLTLWWFGLLCGFLLGVIAGTPR